MFVTEEILYSMARIGYPKFGYPRVIPEPDQNSGMGWVGFVSEFHGYFRAGYP
jgi:hypothetical protein